jgi:hypothetical protein
MNLSRTKITSGDWKLHQHQENPPNPSRLRKERNSPIESVFESPVCRATRLSDIAFVSIDRERSQSTFAQVEGKK